MLGQIIKNLNAGNKSRQNGQAANDVMHLNAIHFFAFYALRNIVRNHDRFSLERSGDPTRMMFSFSISLVSVC